MSPLAKDQKKQSRQPVSVVIPTYKGLGLLQKNLPVVLKSLGVGDEIVIVDDASGDEVEAGLRWLQEEFSAQAQAQKVNLKILVNKENLRFGASCNRGVKSAQHDLIFLLNNDVSPHKDCLKYLVPHFDNKKVFGVGCLEIEHKKVDGKMVEQNHGKNKLWFERGLFIHSKDESMSSGETAWVIGGSGLFDRAKWLELGGFDESFYPAYWEDIDLSFRARQRGWKVLFESKAQVDHNHESTNMDVFGQKKLDQISWQNSLKFTFKNGDIWQKIAFIIWQPYWWWQRSKL